MRTIVAVLGLLLFLTACDVGVWLSANPPLEDFVVPNATNVSITSRRWNEWEIRYEVPGAKVSWYQHVARNLEANEWTSPGHPNYGELSRSYNHAWKLGPLELWEWAFITFDPKRPQVAYIRVRHWIDVSPNAR